MDMDIVYQYLHVLDHLKMAKFRLNLCLDTIPQDTGLWDDIQREFEHLGELIAKVYEEGFGKEG